MKGEHRPERARARLERRVIAIGKGLLWLRKLRIHTGFCGRMSFLGIAVCFLIASCRQDMYNQPKVKPYSASDFFSDGSNARPLPPHTVEYQSGNREDALHTGVSNGTLVARMPVPLTPGLLERGRECFGIYCAVCHGLTGEGDGEVVRRGFPAPPTYHSDRLRNAPIGHLYDVITNGYGVMYSYASRLAPEDRWAVAAYIRALQLSQHALLSDLPPNEQERVETVP